MPTGAAGWNSIAALSRNQPTIASTSASEHNPVVPVATTTRRVASCARSSASDSS
jgi:hypothetical protein